MADENALKTNPFLPVDIFVLVKHEQDCHSRANDLDRTVLNRMITMTNRMTLFWKILPNDCSLTADENALKTNPFFTDIYFCPSPIFERNARAHLGHTTFYASPSPTRLDLNKSVLSRQTH
jgi:hypothetical protein